MTTRTASRHVEPVRGLPPRPATPGRPVRVALVNDFELVLRGVEAMLEPYRDQVVIVERDVRDRPRRRVDVALYDTYGHRGGVDRIRALADDPRVGAVAVYAWLLDVAPVAAVQEAGARGVLDKALTAPELARDLLAIAAGDRIVSARFLTPADASWPGDEFGLTIRESEVGSLLVQGLSNREISESLHISEHTVKTHLKAIFNKTGTRSRGQAVARIAAHGSIRRTTSG